MVSKFVDWLLVNVVALAYQLPATRSTSCDVAVVVALRASHVMADSGVAAGFSENSLVHRTAAVSAPLLFVPKAKRRRRFPRRQCVRSPPLRSLRLPGLKQADRAAADQVHRQDIPPPPRCIEHPTSNLPHSTRACEALIRDPVVIGDRPSNSQRALPPLKAISGRPHSWSVAHYPLQIAAQRPAKS